MKWFKNLFSKEEFNAESMNKVIQQRKKEKTDRLRESIRHAIKERSEDGGNNITVWCNIPPQIINELKEEGFKIKYEELLIPNYEISW